MDSLFCGPIEPLLRWELTKCPKIPQFWPIFVVCPMLADARLASIWTLLSIFLQKLINMIVIKTPEIALFLSPIFPPPSRFESQFRGQNWPKMPIFDCFSLISAIFRPRAYLQYGGFFSSCMFRTGNKKILAVERNPD